MTYEEIADNLKAAIKDQMGFPVFLLPQTAGNNTAHIDMQFQDCSQNGEDSNSLNARRKNVRICLIRFWKKTTRKRIINF